MEVKWHISLFYDKGGIVGGSQFKLLTTVLKIGLYAYNVE